MIVGISGYARSGKDEAAKALIAAGWRRDAFADRLRAFLLAQNPIVLYPVPGGVPEYTRLSVLVNDIGWERAKLESPEVADLLLRCGTEAGRRVLGADVWVNAVMREYDLAMNSYSLNPADEPRLVITDVRFENEAEAIRQRGGLVIRIERPGVLPRRTSSGAWHVSETALDDYEFDSVILNDGTPEDLRRDIAARLSFWL